MTGELIPFPSPEKQESESNEVKYISRPERIAFIKAELSFYPHDNDEASRALSLAGHAHRPFPVLAHFNKVSQHQRRYNVSERDALRGIVHKFDSYAGNALNEIGYLEQLEGVVAAIEPHPFSTFHTTFPREDWQFDNDLKASFTALTRYRETDAFVTHGADDRLGKRALIDATSGEKRIERIVDALDDVRMGSFKEMTEVVKQDQIHRLEYWTARLEESSRHMHVRDIATVALEDLRRDYSS